MRKRARKDLGGAISDGRPYRDQDSVCRPDSRV
jgi:hypothetical protein